MTLLPRMFRVRQHFHQERLESPGIEMRRCWERASFVDKICSGDDVAVAVGSRGIANLAELVKGVIEGILERGAKPWIVPAMGSHGGGTADGQKQILESLGVTEEAMGCEIRSCMETEIVGETIDGVPIHFDRIALLAKHLVVLNRVKPHTRFSGSIQSGLLKMLMIGLGKRNGASTYHRANQQLAFDRMISTVIPVLMEKTPLLGGIALVENSLDETAHIEAVAPEHMLQREPELLGMATALIPRLPFARADLLIIDQIGKEISGTGMDTNVIGRKQYDKHAGLDEYPKIHQIYVRGLTEKTHGNAAGIGLAEYCRASLVKAIDYEATKINSITAGHVTAAAIPAYFETDREVLEIATEQAGLSAVDQLDWMWIQDTLHLGEVLCSEAYYEEATKRSDLELLGSPQPIEFGRDNQLLPAFSRLL